MKPGTYTVTLYQGEIEAGTGSVTVSAGRTSSVNLSSNLSRPNTIWTIGKSGPTSTRKVLTIL
jgi:rhamnogalacturonan endolyase